MSDRLSEIRARLDKASDDIGLTYRIPADEWEVTCDKGTSQLLTHAPSDIRWLLGEVERLSAQINTVREQVAREYGIGDLTSRPLYDAQVRIVDLEGTVRHLRSENRELEARIARGGDPS